MKEIGFDEQHEILLEILKYFDKLCRENNIKYTLIGGSLIGAIRHKGFIPWDDDIDVGMTRENYEKILSILQRENGRYRLLSSISTNNAFIFEKLVDTKTYAIEPNMLHKDPSYGIFLDIFTFHNVPDNKKEREKNINKSKLIVSLFSRKKLSKEESVKKNTLRLFKNIVSIIIGYKKLNKIAKKHFNRYDNTETKYCTSNWPFYSNNRETQKTSNFKKYIDVEFEGMKAMVIANYDDVLSHTFGNYMKLPPKEQQINRHNMKAYWRDEK